MKCKLVGQKLRGFSKAVRLLSKLSNEVLIIADNNKMKLQCINENKTAFVEILFQNRYFTSYECENETKCKLFMKSLFLVFRILNIDKSVNSCTLIMDESMPRIIFEMKCRNGVNREYFLPYMESNHLRYTSDTNQLNLTFKVESKLMSECLQNFSNETKDISVWLTSSQILFKTYCDDFEEQNIMTSFSYKSREFQNYNINNEISVTFNLKDLKYFVEFATFHEQNIDCYFESSGKPIQFVINTNEYYSAKLMLATHDFPEDQQPIPPSIANNTQSNSLMSSADLSIHLSLPLSAQTANHSSIGETAAGIPECILNTSMSNASNSFPNNNQNIDNSEDPFGDDDNIIEEMLSQMPDFSMESNRESIPSSETIARLSGSELNRYHNSVLFSNLDDFDDNNLMANSQDILVPDSDDDN